MDDFGKEKTLASEKREVSKSRTGKRMEQNKQITDKGGRKGRKKEYGRKKEGEFFEKR
jgi:hypothetical protein